jgi:glycosyltransferase involved in cell wall biosynthesis
VKQSRVLFVQYTHPAGFPPIERAARILQSNGWGVRLIGAGGIGTDALAAEARRTLDVRLASRSGRGVVQKLQYARFLLLCAWHVFAWRPDWVYVSDSFATPIGMLAHLTGLRVVYHEHDRPTDESPSRFVRMILGTRRALLMRAGILITPNEERSVALSSEAEGQPVLTIWNCPSLTEVKAPGKRSANGALKLVYHGSIVPGRPPLALLEAMARAAGPVELHVAGYETLGSRGYVNEILRRANECGVGDRVNVSLALPRDELLERASRCDLGLSLMPTRNVNVNESRMAGASNKAFEYLACGIPLIVSDLNDWRRLFVDGGVAWACDPADVASIVQVLDRALKDREKVIRMGERGRELVLREWNYETQFAPVLSAMAPYTDQ